MIKLNCFSDKDALQLVERGLRINDKQFKARLVALA